MKQPKKARSLTLRCLLETARRNLFLMVGLSIAIAAVVLLSLVPPQILRTVIDTCLVPKSTEALLPLAFSYLGVIILVGVFDFCKGGLLTVFGQRLVNRLRRAMTEKLSRIGTRYFSQHPSGEITSRFTADVENVNALFSDGVISMVIDCFKIVGIIVSIWVFSGTLGIITLCLVPVIYTVTRTFQKKMLRAQIENLEQLGRVNSHISETLKNVRMIKSFSKEAYMESLYRQRLQDNFNTVERVNFYDSCYSPIIQIVRASVISAIVLLSSKQLNYLGISLGMVAASIELISNLFAPIEALGMELQNVQKGLSGVRRLNDFDKEPEEPKKDASLTADALLAKKAGLGLAFDHVSFSYDPSQPVLCDVNLTARPGESVTFAGRTGVGKTTLFRLIMGLLEPTSGRILLDGHDVYAIPNAEKRRLFGYVEQQFSYIRGSIADQISLCDPAVSQSDVERAMRFVGLHETVLGLPAGYDTVITGHGDFSQGQEQLLCIARAIAADPAVLLLDEVTANLDSVTETHIMEILKKAGQGRTVLSISHRMTAMLHCDRIVLLENGRVLRSGTPEAVFREDAWLQARLHLEENTWNS